ncbi:phosphatidylserine decarboxylase [Bacillus songklensis]|uniref:Phosphatidylserine decarboxylase proenzyme n=1 Tax=Bacillus songklensis TaxID=1069116 RepID=A0ABV8AYH1_9BACI
MFERIYQIFIELTNHALFSKLLQKFSTSRASAVLLSSYARVYKINQSEMADNLKNYENLQQLFIRQLKEGVRPIDQTLNGVVSPVDAVIEEYGYIDPAKEMKVKGKVYSIEEMVGNDKLLEKYIGGLFMIFYLSPRDYHRIHSPLSGTITNMWTLGNRSYPVNKWGMKYGKDPLTKNYRKLTELLHPYGNMLMVKVGAMFINSIERTHEGESVTKGDEMAYFTFGSTVVLLFEKGTFILNPNIEKEQPVKVGQLIGVLKEK